MATSSYELNDDQKTALKTLEATGNVFLTGSAGSGKSFLLNHYRRTARSTYPVLASTGAAAVLIGGRTFHSFFGLGILEGGAAATVEKALKNGRVRKRLKDADGFVIDEISMISGEVLSVAEAIARRVRASDEPWGGLRVIAVGDFCQLPPVSRNSGQRDWAFLHPVWSATAFTPIMLRTIVRTSDEAFLKVLNFVRDGVVNAEVEAFLNSRTRSAPRSFDGTRLFARREQTDLYNTERLEQLSGASQTFDTTYHGAEKRIADLKRTAPIGEVLHLKDGALVMVRYNDPEGRWVNGTTGHVADITNDAISLTLENGETATIEPVTFSLLDDEGERVASATNFPLTLAYAATIHKAQGMTLDRMVVDLKALWEPGHAYVALSRVRRGDDLYIDGWGRGSVRVDPKVVAFHRGI